MFSGITTWGFQVWFTVLYVTNEKVRKPQYEGRKYINFKEVTPSSVREPTDGGGDTS